MNMVVVLRDDWSDSVLQEEVSSLEAMLQKVMHNRQVATCAEVADLNRYRLYNKFEKVFDLLQKKQTSRPFIFLLGLN